MEKICSLGCFELNFWTIAFAESFKRALTCTDIERSIAAATVAWQAVLCA